MKPEDMEFVRSQMNHNRPDIQRLLSLLIESEAMREKAEFWRKYPTHKLAISDAHQWLDADWQEFVEKEWGI